MRSIANATSKIRTYIDLDVEHTDGTVKDISSRVRSIRWGADVDRKDWWCEMELTNNPDLHVANNLSLNPLDSLSTLNQNGSSVYYPLLSDYHEVRFKLRKDAGDPWALVFQGLAVRVPSAGQELEMADTVSFSPVGMSQLYKDTPRMSQWLYEARDLATLTASILLDSEFQGDRKHIVVEDDPSYHVGEYTTGEVNTWEALQNAIKKTGYILAVKHQASGTPFADGSGGSTSAAGFFPTLYDPLRVGGNLGSADSVLIQDSRALDATLTGDWVKRDVAYDIKDVRTWVQIYYLDRVRGGDKNVIVEDDTAKAQYGVPDGGTGRLHRKMRIVEDKGSCIDTEGEATDFAYGCLHDLSSPTPDVVIDLNYCWPEPEPHDYIRFVGSDFTIDVGVMSIEHILGVDDWIGRTVIRGTINKVIGERAWWIAHEMTDEERNKVMAEWLLGGMEQLGYVEGWGEGDWGDQPWGSGPSLPRNLHLRTFTHQANDGHFVSAVAASWEKCNQWWFDHTDVFVSIGNNARYGDEPYVTTRKTHAMISPVPPGGEVYVKVRYMPINPIGTLGRIGR